MPLERNKFKLTISNDLLGFNQVHRSRLDLKMFRLAKRAGSCDNDKLTSFQKRNLPIYQILTLYFLKFYHFLIKIFKNRGNTHIFCLLLNRNLLPYVQLIAICCGYNLQVQIDHSEFSKPPYFSPVHAWRISHIWACNRIDWRTEEKMITLHG